MVRAAQKARPAGSASGRRRTGRRADGRPVLTGRAMVLGGVVVLLVVLLAAPVHRYLASRQEITSTTQSLADDRAEMARLRAQLRKWSDPAFVAQRAREQLQYALPGETVYVVRRQGQSSDIGGGSGDTAQQAAGPGWNDRLWNSVRAAGK